LQKNTVLKSLTTVCTYTVFARNAKVRAIETVSLASEIILLVIQEKPTSHRRQQEFGVSLFDWAAGRNLIQT
jgi:hypothetical protein